MNHPTDYFVHMGYRKLVLRMLLQTMGDLQLKPGSAENNRLIKEAQDWVKYESAPVNLAQGLRQGGLAFSDCFYALGQASNVEKMRKVSLEEPQRVFRAVSALMDEMNADEAVFADARESRHGESLTVGNFDTSWLFGGQPKSESVMRGGANG